MGLSREILLTLGVTAGALGLFVWNRLRPDVVGLLVLATLILLGLVSIEEGLSGFANEATITVALMLALSTGLLRTGAIDLVGHWAGRLAGDSEWRLLVVVLATVVPVSAFINNTAAVAILLPMVLGLSRRVGASPSRLLMPLSFGSQMGGSLTLIGTSTNLLVAGLVLDLGLPRIRIFDITPPALVITAVGVIYLLTVGRWLMPSRKVAPDLVSGYELREYLTGLIVEAHSPLVGRTLSEARFAQRHGLHVVAMERAGERITHPRATTALQSGDLLLVRGKVPEIAQVEETEGLAISGATPDLGLEETEGETRLAEVIVTPRSHARGRNLRELDFRARYDVTALAIQRHGVPLQDALGSVALAPGDILLVQGSAEALHRLHQQGDFAMLGAVDLPAKRVGKMRIAVGIMAAVVLLAALGVMPILVSALLGVLAMLLTGCITPDEAYGEMDWMVLVLLGSILPLGIAMQKSGAAEFLAGQMLRVTAPAGEYGAVAGLYLTTSLLTELISNNAAAVVLTPIAVALAQTLGISPLPLVVAVMFAASNSFMTPIGYQTNTFIYGPGGYRFSDFVRVGAPLNLLLVAVATFAIPFFLPFHAR